MKHRARKHLTVVAAVGALALLGPGVALASGVGSQPTTGVTAPATGLLAQETTDAAEPPAAEQPATEPAAAEPAATEPAAAEPAAAEPAAEPAAAEQPAAEPAAAEQPAQEPTDAAGPAAAAPAAPAAPAPAPEPDTAAEIHGWGAPLPQSDEFNYTGQPDPSKWVNIDGCWSGHDGNGKRCGANSTVDGEKLIQKGLPNGDTGWLASKLDQQYGRWEARVRSFNDGDSGNEYHPLLIVWPSSDSWPNDGEYDFLENQAPGEDCANAFIHYPHPNMPVQQEFLEEDDCGAPLSEWHNIAFEWTPDHVRGYIDGKEWYTLKDGAGPGGRANIQGMPSGKLTIQFDNFYGGGMREASYEIDWVRMYTLEPQAIAGDAKAGPGGASTPGATAGPGGASAGDDTTAPSVTTAPDATAPSATAPSATAPSATAPSATAPSATAPSATAPSATAPSATAPSATAPSDTTPADTATANDAPAATQPAAAEPAAAEPAGDSPSGSTPASDTAPAEPPATGASSTGGRSEATPAG
ncbi:glycoside hydrolase family 16 protein [Pseudonocardia oroxyli]|uniref:Glycosyl hydrolases family 16 n=1 Tax=Pseudonocardia oroxyli TaxID=366584 RepID=A0A1G7EQY6_PSEOR|nr:glycoside hydrolase family 16 protein [Pseudonocardia oroxyli]SDE66118.1 Glycosyl hydrolases family 16 [Pseudonocardia oroxyli]